MNSIITVNIEILKHFSPEMFLKRTELELYKALIRPMPGGEGETRKSCGPWEKFWVPPPPKKTPIGR